MPVRNKRTTAGGGRTAAQGQFSTVPTIQQPRSTFNRSHGLKTTLNAALLVPIFVDEVIPGDTWTMSLTTFARMATPFKPFMDNLYLETHWWFVPNRLVWRNWQAFMGEKPTPDDTTEYMTPILAGAGVPPSANQWFANTLGDYFGLPIAVSQLGDVQAMPFRGFHLIWNSWYRDQNLQDPIFFDDGDGPDDADNYFSGAYQGTDFLPRRGKRHDYFSASLPWPQKGAAVQLPLGDSAPVDPVTVNAIPTFFVESGGGDTDQLNVTGANAVEFAGSNPSQSILHWGDPMLHVDLSTATASTINNLRQAFQIQRMFERDARSGTRYVELLKAHYGVMAEDYRLQRPEFLGSTSQAIHVNPVAQTINDDTAGELLGDLAAYVTSAHTGRGWTKSFVEHGFVFGIANIRGDISYQEGKHKMWTRRAREDHYFPALAHLGEQPVKSFEIYMDGTGDPVAETGDYSIWGYIPRWDEYRYAPSRITGLFRSTAPSPLDIWHLALHFDATRPQLNDAFITDQPPMSRVIAVPTGPEFLLDCYFNYRTVRPMPAFGVPGMIDHF